MKEIWQKRSWQQKLASLFTIALVFGVYWDYFHGTQGPQSQANSLTTMIPKGYVIQTLDLASPEALDVLVDDFAYVSLYQVGSEKPFVTGLKVFRAPKAPQQFVALIPTEHSKLFVQNNQNLLAIVQPNPPKSGTEFVSTKSKSSRTIVYGNN